MLVYSVTGFANVTFAQQIDDDSLPAAARFGQSLFCDESQCAVSAPGELGGLIESVSIVSCMSSKSNVAHQGVYIYEIKGSLLSLSQQIKVSTWHNCL